MLKYAILRTISPGNGEIKISNFDNSRENLVKLLDEDKRLERMDLDGTQIIDVWFKKYETSGGVNIIRMATVYYSIIQIEDYYDLPTINEVFNR
jgi:hypothetical protein